MVSAVRVDGKRLHELAREGKEVERKARKVTVYRFAMTPTDDPLVYRAEVECSSGTYIRTLAADLGTALGGGAHLTNLRRTKIGSFGEAEAKPVEDLVVLPAKEGLRDYPQTTVDEDNAFLVSNGRVLDPDQLGGVTGPGPWAVRRRGGQPPGGLREGQPAPGQAHHRPRPLTGTETEATEGPGRVAD